MNIEASRERLIAYWRESIAETPSFLKSSKSEGKINLLMMNYRMWAEAHFNIGVLYWRRGEDPRPEFAAGLDAIGQAVEEAEVWPASKRDIDVLRLWKCHPIAYLMDRSLPALEGTDEQLKDFPLIAASFLLADALYDRPYRDRLPAMMKALGAKKRQMLALLTFQTYFDLLEAKGDEARVAELAAQGDALYLRRAKDVFYDDLGGPPNNPLMLDWQLAAVLKKVGFSGESLHRWRWD